VFAIARSSRTTSRSLYGLSPSPGRAWSNNCVTCRVVDTWLNEDRWWWRVLPAAEFPAMFDPRPHLGHIMVEELGGRHDAADDQAEGANVHAALALQPLHVVEGHRRALHPSRPHDHMIVLTTCARWRSRAPCSDSTRACCGHASASCSHSCVLWEVTLAVEPGIQWYPLSKCQHQSS
jgi:hypothetical protein